MKNAELIRDLLKKESQQKVFVSGSIVVNGKEEHILMEIAQVKEAEVEGFNGGEKFIRLIF